jgi:hypothetical protein
MKKRLASLFLLLALFATVFAGVPVHFGETECAMPGMMGMDCCKTAHLQQETAEVANAKLCCALDCAQNGTTSPPNTVTVVPPCHSSMLPEFVKALPPTFVPLNRNGNSHSPPGSPPTYLRNLTLLI